MKGGPTGWEHGMFDPTDYGGGGGYPRCCCCDRPIFDERQGVRIEFLMDPHGHKGLTGLYHRHCSAPFQAAAEALAMCRSSRL